MESHTWKIEWNEGMSVGIPEVDADHKRFISEIDALNRSIVDRMEQDEIKRRLLLILDDTVRHFAREEELFREWRYPDAEQHAHRHAEITRTLQAIQERFVMYGLPSEWITAGLKVKDILIGHFLTEDLKYAEYFRNARKARGEAAAGPASA